MSHSRNQSNQQQHSSPGARRKRNRQRFKTKVQKSPQQSPKTATFDVSSDKGLSGSSGTAAVADELLCPNGEVQSAVVTVAFSQSTEQSVESRSSECVGKAISTVEVCVEDAAESGQSLYDVEGSVQDTPHICNDAQFVEALGTLQQLSNRDYLPVNGKCLYHRQAASSASDLLNI
jgi:hypothetical protein